MKKRIVFILLLLSVLLLPMAASAAGDLDEIVQYTVTAEVNPDATVTLTYHIEWKVLDSSSEGPLEWVTIGIPTRHCTDVIALSGSLGSCTCSSASRAHHKKTVRTGKARTVEETEGSVRISERSIRPRAWIRRRTESHRWWEG